jgi:hypothetical protein
VRESITRAGHNARRCVEEFPLGLQAVVVSLDPIVGGPLRALPAARGTNAQITTKGIAAEGVGNLRQRNFRHDPNG